MARLGALNMGTEGVSAQDVDNDSPSQEGPDQVSRIINDFKLQYRNLELYINTTLSI